MEGPLQGIRAVEWATGANGPVIGVILSDLGADVVKIEERGGHDTHETLPSGINAGRENTNRGKRSIALDLKKEKGRGIFYKLIEQADVFYTNYGQSLAERLGVDYQTLSKINPRLIYANATGYGPRGPDSENRVYDPAGQARSGLMTSLGEFGTPPSKIVGNPIDCLGATIGVLGILAALAARARTGEGQMTNTSLLSSAIWLQLFNIQTGLLRAGTRKHIGNQRHSTAKPASPLNNHYKCSDDKWLLLGESQFERFWGEFCQDVGIRETEYVKFDSSALRKEDNVEKVTSFLAGIFATKPRDEWIALFKQKGARFVYAPVNEVSDLLYDEQVLSNNYILEFEHPVAGLIKLVNHPVEYSKTPAKIKSAAPEFGQHTEHVLLDLGYTFDDITKLREAEVI